MDDNTPDDGSAREDLGIPELLTSQDVAAALQTSRDQILRLCREGQLGYVQVGREKRFTREQVHDFVDRQTRHPWAAAGEPPGRGGTRAGREF